MDFWQTMILAVGLSMDSVALCVIIGMAGKSLNSRRMAAVALIFGFFQMIMPAVGYALGELVDDYLGAAVPFISASLLLFLGGRMLIKRMLNRGQAPDTDVKIAAGSLIAQAAVTSLDSLAVGFVFVSGTVQAALLSCLEIGALTFLIAFFCILLGKKFGMLFKGRAEIVGGLLLVGLGLKTLIENLLPLL